MAYKRRIQYNMFDQHFQASLDPTHELVLLADRIEWDSITRTLLPYYPSTGRPAKSIRLMVGIEILKHRLDTSDEQSVAHLQRTFTGLDFVVFRGVRVMGPRSSSSLPL